MSSKTSNKGDGHHNSVLLFSVSDMTESPLKLVESSVMAAGMRQRTHQGAVLSGLHFKAPSKLISNPDSEMGPRRSSKMEYYANIGDDRSAEPAAKMDYGQKKTTTPMDESPHTSEYGSLADTHSTKSDSSRLSSPRLTSKAIVHEKSPSWPEAYYKTSPTTTIAPSSESPSAATDPSAMDSRVLSSCYGSPSDYAPTAAATDTSTLKRCSAQSMREICPKLLQRLQQPSSIGRYYAPRRSNLMMTTEGGLLRHSKSSGHLSRSMFDRSADNNPMDRSTDSVPSSARSMDRLAAVNGNDRSASTDDMLDEETNGADYYHHRTASHPTDYSENGKSDREERINRKSIESDRVEIADEKSTTFDERLETTIDDKSMGDRSDEYLRSFVAGSNGGKQQRQRYQQRVQHKSPAQSSIRRKLLHHHHHSIDTPPPSAAKSLPDLAMQTSPVEDTLAYATSQRYIDGRPEQAVYAVPQKILNCWSPQSEQGYGGTRMMTTGKPSPPPPLPRKPPPPAATPSAISHVRRSSDTALGFDDHDRPAELTANGPSVAMIARKLFADQIRANSLSPSNSNTSSTAGNSNSNSSTKTNSTSSSSSSFAVQTRMNYPATVGNNGDSNSNFPASTRHTSNSNFPATNPTRRVVQVHPMCMTDVREHRSQYSTSSSSSSFASTVSSSGMNSPPNSNPNLAGNLNYTTTRKSMDDCLDEDDRKKTSPNYRERPPVPKKPTKLVGSSSKLPPDVPARPPKPSHDGYATRDNLNSNSKTRDNDDSNGDYDKVQLRHATDDTSPYKYRKRMDDEEKYRELTNYVALKSNDSSLKQILAPNQRSSIDYLEECFANVRLSTNNFGSGEEIEKKSNGHGRNASHPLRTLSSDSIDLEKEKIDLIARMSRKLKVLKEEQRAVSEEIRCNNELGSSIFTLIDDRAMELSKTWKDRFAQFVVDTENITQLLLKLSCQLAKLDNELTRIGQASQEKRQDLSERRDRLMDRLGDAKELREDLDRRGEQITAVLHTILTREQLADYQYFIQMKYKLLLDSREIDDKIKLGEDQKRALELSLAK